MSDADRISPTDERLHWLGAVSTAEHDLAGQDRVSVQPWRLPHDQLALFAEPLVDRAAMPAGVRIAFDSDTTLIAGAIEANEEMAPIDLVVDGTVIGSLPLAGQGNFEFDDLPAGQKSIELWLPQFGTFVLSDLWLSQGAALSAPAPSRSPRWIAYGSSITQCRAAASPTLTWPAIVAREKGWELTCLGYGGQCHLDVSVARMIRDLPADYISICAGINIYGGATLNERTFRPALIGFIQVVREKHPEIPIAVMSPIFSPDRETTENAVGFTLQAMRQEVAAAVAALTDAGDRNLRYLDGLDIFGPELAEHLPDDLHPDAEGYQIMARRYLDHPDIAGIG